MAFSLFEPFFNKIDTTTETFVTSISSRAIAELTPFVTLGLSVFLIMYGIQVMRGTVDMPVSDFIGRAIRIGIITSVGLAGGLYQSQIAQALVELPDALALALIADATTAANAGSLVDTAASNGLDRASEAFEKASFFSGQGVVYGLFGLLILLTTSILTAVGGAFVILAKIALALLAGLGPFFVFALLFQATYRFFELWVGQVINYSLLLVLFAAVFGFMMEIFGNYMSDLKFDGQQNVAYALGGATMLAIAMVILLLQLPSIASGLAGGVGLGYFWELRALRGGASGAGRMARAGGRAMYGRGAKKSDGSRGASTGMIPAAGRGASRAAGYFRGSKA